MVMEERCACAGVYYAVSLAGWRELYERKVCETKPNTLTQITPHMSKRKRRIKTNKSLQKYQAFFHRRWIMLYETVAWVRTRVRSICFLLAGLLLPVVCVFCVFRCVLPLCNKQVNFPLICMCVGIYFRGYNFLVGDERLALGLDFFICPFDQFVTYDFSPSTILDVNS